MDVIESFDGCKTARRNLMRFSRDKDYLKNNKNNTLCTISNPIYRYFSGIIDWIYILFKRFFKALSSAGKHDIGLFEWFYFEACKALKGLKNLHTSRKSHD
jgi:hypothetical protein